MLKHLPWMLIGMLVATAGLIGGWVLYTHQKTGEWRLPDGDDLIRVKAKLGVRPERAPKTIYLHRGPIELTGGDDDARRNVSSIVGRSTNPRVKLKGYRGSDRRWQQIASCVRATFRPFDLDIVEERPSTGDYMMVVVGGKPDAIGYQSRHVGGLAPFNGQLINNAVVFAFSDTLRNGKRAVCNTIAMEVAHAYGLDHAYNCSDIMTYLPDCGPKYFRDKDVPCGEHKPRPCPDGRKTQNSYRTLERLVGLRESAE